jgi:hypothetical protein
MPFFHPFSLSLSHSLSLSQTNECRNCTGRTERDAEAEVNKEKNNKKGLRQREIRD